MPSKKGGFVGYAARYFHKKYAGVYVKYPLFFCWILMKLEYSRQTFEKYSHETEWICFMRTERHTRRS